LAFNGFLTSIQLGQRQTKRRKAQPTFNEPPAETLDVFVFGNGEGGELGLGVVIKDKLDPTIAPYPTRNEILDAGTVGVVQVAAGGMHSVALTRDGDVFTWGVNDMKALGRDTQWEEPPEGNPDDVADLNPLESTPSAIPLDSFGAEPLRITGVTACDSASFALTDDGRVYGWGSFRVCSNFPYKPA
jgi:regulator of chromosome condensation